MTSRTEIWNTVWNRKAILFYLEFKQYLGMFAAYFVPLAALTDARPGKHSKLNLLIV